MSAARAFLRPAMKRDNVRVEMNALATKILFEGKRAVGVEYVQNGETQTARAGREVILSGGSVNSPQLLQLSGVGPAGPARRVSAFAVVHANDECRRATCRTIVGINYTFKGQGADAQPDPAALVGQARWSACTISCCAPARCRCR